MKIRNKIGVIQINGNVIASIARRAAVECIGVKGMTAHNLYDGAMTLLKKDRPVQGVRVTQRGKAVDIELHLILEHGVNMKTVARSIMDTVRYNVVNCTGIQVGKIDIFVDNLAIENE